VKREHATTTPPPQLLTARQAAAEYAGVHVATWWEMVAAGRAPAPVKLSPRCTRWRRKDLEAWVDGLAQAKEQSA